MKISNKQQTTRRVLLVITCIIYSVVSFSQDSAVTKKPGHLGGAVTITNNGISLVPNLSLGKPAAIFDVNIGRRLTFEPSFRFALEGKPWSFILWWRYRILEGEKLKITAGAHPALAFRNKSVVADEISQTILTVHRYLAGEISPSYSLNKKISMGIYYLYARCVEKNPSTANTNLLELKINFSDIRLYEKYYLQFYPQLYYLKMDKKDGLYYSASLNLGKRGFPLSVSSMISNIIKTEIPQDKKCIWNIGLVYSFNKDYIEK